MKAVRSALRVRDSSLTGPDRRQRRHQPGQHPQADEQRDEDVRHEVDLDPLELLEAERARGDRGDREQAVGRQPGQKVRHARERRAHDGEHVHEGLLALDADERHADHHREQHDRRHDVVGERVKRIRRNEQRDEIERRALFHERRAEERAALDDGKRERHEEGIDERHQPQRDDDRADPQTEQPRFVRPQRPEARDDRDRHVGQDGHLEQLDEALGGPLQDRRLLAEEQADEDAGAEADQDLVRKTQSGRAQAHENLGGQS